MNPEPWCGTLWLRARVGMAGGTKLGRAKTTCAIRKRTFSVAREEEPASAMVERVGLGQWRPVCSVMPRGVACKAGTSFKRAANRTWRLL